MSISLPANYQMLSKNQQKKIRKELYKNNPTNNNIKDETKDIDNNVYDIPTFNIAILGCVNSGKTTLMNSALGAAYSDMKEGRHTMCPQVYTTDRDIKKCKSTTTLIRKQNQEINKRLIDMNDNSCNEIHHMVSSLPSIFDSNKYNDSIQIRVYDIPGLNDSSTSDILYKYVYDNFYKFDIIIFNIDINQGLDTSDPIKILELIKKCQENISKIYNRQSKLIVVCNKCDDMSIEDSQLQGNSNHEDMYNKICKIIKDNNFDCPVIKYSALYAYIYRSLLSDEQDYNDNIISENIIKQLGLDLMGRPAWKRESKDKTLNELWELLKTYLKNDNSLDSLEESLLSTGFNMLKSECENIINNHAIDLVYSKINYHNNTSDYDTKYKFMYRLNRMFGPNKYSDDIYKYFDEYFANFEKENNITIISQNNRDELDSIINNLEQMTVKYDKIMEIKKYIILQKINTYQNMIADYNIECLKSSELSFDEFITSLKAIVESSYYGKEKLDSIENYSIFDKIELDKFHIIVKYLISKEFNREYLIDMYKTKLINVINNSPERELVRTYILKLYIKTDKDIFNELYSRISPYPLQSIVYNEYNVLCKRFEEFMEC
jgi:GTPase Era involved in 16S rRNA processing